MNISRLPGFDPAIFTQRLLDWFSAKQRPLPWRQDYSPYRVWISEIMLQQTQMERGVAYFNRWVERFPDISSVAAASEDELLKAWEGLGYYSRVRNLAKAARQIMNLHGGVFPSRLEDIRALPGVGPYTAAAIASIAFNADVALADANVNRIFARVFDIDEPVRRPKAQKRIAALAAALLPHGSARNFNQALMEFGSLVCAKKPLCADCPVSNLCEARRLGIVQERPIAEARPEVTRIAVAAGVLRHPERGAELFIQKRRDDDLWPGLWEFPGGVVEAGESPEQTAVREFAEETGISVRIRAPIALIHHAYTRYRVTLHGFWCDYVSGPLESPLLTEASTFRWVRDTRLADFAFPAGYRRLADRVCPDLPLLRSKVLSKGRFQG
jgi:A/G-specific adenine glycosylase